MFAWQTFSSLAPFKHRGITDILVCRDGDLRPRLRVFAQAKTAGRRGFEGVQPRIGEKPGEGQLADLRRGLGRDFEWTH